MNISAHELAEELLVERLRAGHSIVWRPLGNSMWPWIRSGLQIKVKPVSKEKAKNLPIGTVILRYGKRIGSVHRLIGYDQYRSPITKGDTMKQADRYTVEPDYVALICWAEYVSGKNYNPNRPVLRKLGFFSGLILPWCIQVGLTLYAPVRSHKNKKKIKMVL